MIFTDLLLAFVILLGTVKGNEDSKKLYTNLLRDYNKLIRPVRDDSERLTVILGLKLSQLISIDEKNQIMTTNVWLSQEWYDYYLQWNPENYGGIDNLYIPASAIWTPDIVLYNNADGSFQVTHSTKATVHSDGRVVWEPPAIYKSFCAIDVEFFPFDEQNCEMKFSSWTYNFDQVDLRHMLQPDINGTVDIADAIDLKEYYNSFIWDVMAVPATRNEKKYSESEIILPDITFSLHLRRKTLFYTVNLIIPCVAISFLTVLVFYLPSDSGEKITLCISILLALTVFILLLSELIPPTSLVVPLIGKYLLFTMLLVVLSIFMAVVSLNLHSRSLTTHVMSSQMKSIFIERLPVLLMMKRPEVEDSGLYPKKTMEASLTTSFKNRSLNEKGQEMEMVSLLSHERIKGQRIHVNGSTKGNSFPVLTVKCKLSPQIEKAFECICFIAEHLKEEDCECQVKEDWKYISLVVDRLFFWLFTAFCVTGTLCIILQAPTLYDEKEPLA